MKLKTGDIVVTRYGIHGVDYHIPVGRKGSVQAVNGGDAQVRFEGFRVDHKVPWTYLDRVEVTS